MPAGARFDTSVDDAPEYVCRHCDHPFPERERLVLHKGLEHPAALTAEEEEEFRETYKAETQELRSFRLKGLVVIVLLYFAFLMMYAIFA